MAVENEEGWSPGTALVELRDRLERGLAERGMTKTALARRSELGRTAVSEAFNRSAPAPSARTVAALAQTLRLDVPELLKLRAMAADVHHETPVKVVSFLPAGVGRPIADFDPHDLEVHPAIDVGLGKTDLEGGQTRQLPGYVRRRHDQELDKLVKAAANGHSGAIVLVGPSSTGKTRACWEAIQPLAPRGWRLWHPFDPTRAEAALNDLQHVGPRTVVWLNEAQHYLGASRGIGEHIASSLRSLLANRSAGPILILGTLWNNYAAEYMTLPAPGKPDLHPQTRDLLEGRLLSLPDSFDTFALRDARTKSNEGDLQLAQALSQAEGGRLTQYLAGAPALTERYKIASPSVRALIQVAMDARRFGLGSRTSEKFLVQAAEDYLTDSEYAALGFNWVEGAFQEATKQVHGNMAPLMPVRLRNSRLGQSHPSDETNGTEYRLADSLDQLGRLERHQNCPPASFWESAYEGLTDPTALANLARAAHDRYRLQWAHRFTGRAADQADDSTLIDIAEMWIEEHPSLAEPLLRQSAGLGNARAMSDLAYLCEEGGDTDGAAEWYKKAAKAGDGEAAYRLAQNFEELGDMESAEGLYRQALDRGDTEAYGALGRIVRDRGGDVFEALKMSTCYILLLIRQTARAKIMLLDRPTGKPSNSTGLWSERKEKGSIRSRIEEAGDDGDFDGFLNASIEGNRSGDTYGIFCHYLLLSMKDRAQAEAELERAGLDGNSHALMELAKEREKADRTDEAVAIYRALLDSGDNASLAPLANLMIKVGNLAEGESLYWRSIEAGSTYAMRRLSEIKAGMGDHASAEELALQAANAGDSTAVRMLNKSRGKHAESDGLFPYGLNPDGTPTDEAWRLG